MAQGDALDSLTRFGQRIRKVFEPASKAESKEEAEAKRQATAKAVGPRYRSTVKKVESAPAKAPTKRGRRRTVRKY